MQQLTKQYANVFTSILALCLAAILATPVWGRSQPTVSDRTVQDGVFTETQSNRGQNLYESHCQTCHGEELIGGQARALVGEDFLRNWIGLALDGLLQRVQTMPPGSAMNLETESYIDIISYILKVNDFPSGGDELKTDVLSTIVVEGVDGPQKVPDQTLVKVVGCLTHGPSNTWMVVNGTEPVRTRDPSGSTAAEQHSLRTMTLGSVSYELLYVFPAPDNLAGHRIEVKGFLIRGEPDRLNVTAITGLNEIDPDCDY